MPRLADVTSAITDQMLPPKTPAEEVRRAGRVPYDNPTPQNSVMLFIDHQIGLMAGIRDFSSLAEYRSYVVGLARTAKALKMPVLISSSNAQWQDGDTLPERDPSTDAPESSTATMTRPSARPSTTWSARPGGGTPSSPASRSAPVARSRPFRCSRMGTRCSQWSIRAARGIATKRRRRCRAWRALAPSS